MNVPNPNLRIVFINGRISSGKDTQAFRLIKGNDKAVRISPGEIIRDARDKDNPYHGILKEHFPVLDSGELVPARTMVGIVAEVIDAELGKGMDTFVVTGFPRSHEYLDELDPILNRYEKERDAKIDFIYLNITPEESLRRTKGRIKAYRINNRELRPEDNPEAFERRTDVFMRETVSVMQRLLTEDRMTMVSAMGSEKETQALIREALDWDQSHGIEAAHSTLPSQARK